MTAVATRPGALAPADPRAARAELIRVLGNSLYPGAAQESIELVLGYCEAAGLDPMEKPCHIVPMWDSKEGRMRDVIMPGIGRYRTAASRTGQFAGMSEPEFGPDVSTKIGGVEIVYPQWARVTAKRLLAGAEIVAEFTAVEYWLENYAVKGGKDKSIAPNAMWQRRPRGQLGKCAQAQALRLAFPELGAAPTAEEMEGKAIDAGEIIHPTATIVEVPSALLAASQAAARQGREGFAKFWKEAAPGDRALLQHELEALKITTEDAEERRAAAAPKDGVVGADGPCAGPPDGVPGVGPEQSTDDFRAALDAADQKAAP